VPGIVENQMESSVTTILMLAVAAAWLGATPSLVTAQKKQRDLITRDELLASAQERQDLYTAIRSLRPHFLQPPRGIRTMGAAPPAPAALYVDGNRQGELDGLRMIQTIDTEEVRYLDPNKAQEEFGISHSGGAVMVRLLKRAGPSQPPPPPHG
jgi:hypothetical protein